MIGILIYSGIKENGAKRRAREMLWERHLEAVNNFNVFSTYSLKEGWMYWGDIRNYKTLPYIEQKGKISNFLSH